MQVLALSNRRHEYEERDIAPGTTVSITRISNVSK